MVPHSLRARPKGLLRLTFEGQDDAAPQPDYTPRMAMWLRHRVLQLSGVCVFAALLGLANACAPVEPQTVSMRLHGGAPDASVTIDDLYIGPLGTVSRRGVALPPGQHRITVEKVGYFPWDHLVDVHEGAPPIHLQVQLIPIPE